MKFIVTLLSVVLTRSYALPIGSVFSSGSLGSAAILTPLENLGDSVDSGVSVFAKSKVRHFNQNNSIWRQYRPLRILIKYVFQAFSAVTPFPDSGRKEAILEQKSLESLPIKIDDKYGNLQGFVAGITHPKPLVDTIRENEKYGNDGEPFRQVSNKVVGGIEGLSNVLNTVAEVNIEKILYFI